MKKYFSWIMTCMMALFVASCSNDENLVAASGDAQVADTRAVGYTPKFTVYIETNDINPLNAGEYTLTGTTTPAIDHVILFASNIRGTASTVELYHNPNQTHILNNVETLVRPLQNKGIKVLLGLLGDHTGVGFANLTAAQIESFAQQVKDCVTTYGLDGVDFDDEYAEYGKISGTPSPSGTNFSNLIIRLRELMPDKLITAFYYGYATGFNQGALDVIDYMWPNFGVRINPASFDKAKWARMSIHYTNGYPAKNTIIAATRPYGDYGAIMMFNMREYDASETMNHFASNVWGKSVTWSGTKHYKIY